MIKPELSEKGKYWIPKERYYELKHFCLQYDWWKKAYDFLEIAQSKSIIEIAGKTYTFTADKTLMKKIHLQELMDMVYNCAYEADTELGSYIFKAVTQGVSYDILYANDNIPCSRNTYYDRYRKFFWLLSKSRDF